MLMLLGAHFGDFGLPTGPQWEHLLGPKLDFWGVIFRRQFLARLGSDLGRGRRQQRSLSAAPKHEVAGRAKHLRTSKRSLASAANPAKT